MVVTKLGTHDQYQIKTNHQRRMFGLSRSAMVERRILLACKSSVYDTASQILKSIDGDAPTDRLRSNYVYIYLVK